MKKLILILMMFGAVSGAKYIDRYRDYPTAPKQILSNGTESWTMYAGGVVSYDSTHYLTAPRAVKLTNNASSVVYAQTNISRQQISGNGTFTIKIYVSDTLATSLYFNLYKNTSGSDAYSFTAGITYANQGMRTGYIFKGWNVIHIDKSWMTATGSPTWDTIQRIRIGAQCGSTNQTNLVIGEVSFVPKQLPRGTFTFRLDDGYPSQVNVLLPKFRQYGWKASFFSIIDWANGVSFQPFKWTGIDSLYRLGGFDIGLHSLHYNNSNLSTLTPDQITEEFSNGGDSIVAHGMPRPKLCALPGNVSSVVLDSIVKIFFDFTCVGNYTTMQPVPFENPTRIQTGINLTGTTTFANVKPKLDSVISFNGYCQLLIHSVGDTNHLSVVAFDSITSYLKSKQDSGLCDIKSMGELLDYVNDDLPVITSSTDTLILNTTATGATGYQWQKKINGTWVDISGATTARLLVVADSALYASKPVYRCAVSNAGGTVYSPEWIVSVGSGGGNTFRLFINRINNIFGRGR